MTVPARCDHFLRHLLQGGGPLMVWALYFFGAYALVAVACCSAFARTPRFGVSALRVSLWAMSALAAIAIALMIVRSLRLPRGLLRSAGLGCGALALIGVAWTALPTLWSALPLCLCQT